jgi:hypothetical protein
MMSIQLIVMDGDGKHIEAGDNSPDRSLNRALFGWGGSLVTAGTKGYQYLEHDSSARLTAFVSAEGIAKMWVTRVENRLTALGL